jgi:glutamate dehydrogenase
LQSGLINTDALDNAAGVNTSDHEVNIKILLAGVQASKKLAESKRRVLLKDMTEDIARLVLEDNAAQALTLTLKERQGVGGVGAVLQLQQALVRKQRLDPPLEFLPTEEEVEERHRQGKGYTRPELSVFMAYAKADIYDDLIQSDLPDDSTLTPWLENYFPSRLAPYERWIGAHPLRRELIATLVTNRLVNRMGLTFLNRMREETGYPTAEVASAFVISSHLLEADRWWDLVVAQTGKIPADVQFELYDVIKKLLEFGAFWLLRNGEHPLRIGQEIATYQQTFNQVGDLLHKTLSPRKHERHRQRVAAWQERGLDPTLAEAFAQVSLLVAVPDLAKLVLTLKPDITTLMKLYFMVGDRLQLARLHTTARYIPISDNWQRVASVAIIDELYFHQRRVTQSILARAKSQESPQQLISKWVGAREGALRQYDRLLEELFDQPSHTHAMLNVMLGQLKGLTG